MGPSAAFDEDGALDALRRVASRHGIKPGQVTPDARLEQDLRLTGDDALEFIEAAAEALAIDMSGFEASLYVGSEGLNPLGGLISGRLAPLRPLTLRHLLDAARLGRWREDTTPTLG